MGKAKIVLGAALVLIGMGSTAYAAGTVSATFNTLTSNNPDVELPINGGIVMGLVETALGPDGLPVASATSGFTDIDPMTRELLWFTPHNDPTNSAIPYVTAGSTNFADGVYPLPFNVTSNFFANGSSNGGANGYISTELKATFSALLGGTVTFNLGSDDDSWIFLNGNLVVDNGGIHGFLNTAFPVTVGLVNGINTIDVFQADRHTTQSGLFFDADVTLNAAVPEPSTWAMMLLGFAGLGYAGYRKASQVRGA